MQNTPIPGVVTGDVFTYQEQVNKLDREIARMTGAELACLQEDAIDYALHAASTGFHLLEWEDKALNLGSKTSARELLNIKANADLNILHDIVTKTKHVTIGNSAYQLPIDVRVSAGNAHVLTVTDVGEKEWSRHRQLFVKFGEERAYPVLIRVLGLFKNTQFKAVS